ncbi:XRE family transcriptional regulator [Streptomyces sp. GMY02]|uniref:XRE family transcriptional regulator n=1 Tax=Streptomyces sp. GMY02 TaxID=1333528 RepID=UPI001C2C4A7A|nr:XRE family transcriptional regulator [Streptomyces sp. GMY02]QXE36176.1 XRE family transcriptional regulator [Streptomyces sp. GMY02]
MTDSQSRTDLSDIVRNRRAELGLSLRKLAERCIDPENPASGPLWKFGVVDRLEKGLPILVPQTPELRALAAGLKLPPTLIKEAAGAQFLGLDTVWADDHETRAMVHDYQAMSPADRERVRDLMRAWSNHPKATD